MPFFTKQGNCTISAFTQNWESLNNFCLSCQFVFIFFINLSILEKNQEWLPSCSCIHTITHPAEKRTKIVRKETNVNFLFDQPNSH